MAEGVHNMSCSYILFTNNPVMKSRITNDRFEIVFIDGTSLEVLKSARDHVHLGARLVTHPLYGNLRPYQQPYRTILVNKPPACGNPISKGGETPGACSYDFESLSLIESALDVYQSCIDRLIRPENLPEHLREDYAYVDFELMRESFSRFGLIKG